MTEQVMTDRPLPVSPGAMTHRLNTLEKILRQIQGGLTGTPFQWGDAERRAYTRKAAALGVTLVTATALKIKGHTLKRGARPVGRAYFKAPLSRYADLYVLECQCRPADGLEGRPPSPPAAEEAFDAEASVEQASVGPEAEETWSLLLTNAEVERLVLMLGYGQPEGFSQDDMTAVIQWAEASRLDAGCLESVLDANMSVAVVNGEVAFKTTAKGMRDIQSEMEALQTSVTEPGDGKGTLLDARA